MVYVPAESRTNHQFRIVARSRDKIELELPLNSIHNFIDDDEL